MAQYALNNYYIVIINRSVHFIYERSFIFYIFPHIGIVKFYFYQLLFVFIKYLIKFVT